MKFSEIFHFEILTKVKAGIQLAGLFFAVYKIFLTDTKSSRLIFVSQIFKFFRLQNVR